MHGHHVDGVIGLVVEVDEDHPRPRPDQKPGVRPRSGQGTPGEREPFEDGQRPLHAPQGKVAESQPGDQIAQVLNRPRRDDDPGQGRRLGEL